MFFLINVSIVIPVYNVEKYLKQCLESVVNQTLDKIEVICINDGSTDNSLNILKEYEKKYNNIIIILFCSHLSPLPLLIARGNFG